MSKHNSEQQAVLEEENRTNKEIQDENIANPSQQENILSEQIVEQRNQKVQSEQNQKEKEIFSQKVQDKSEKQEKEEKVQSRSKVQQPEESKVQSDSKISQPKEDKTPRPEDSGQQISSQSKKRNSLEKEQSNGKKKQEIKIESKISKTPTELLSEFFSNQANSNISDIKQNILSMVNEEVKSKIYINPLLIIKYLQSEGQHSYDGFKEWYIKEEQTQIEQLIQQFSISKQRQQLEGSLNAIRLIVSKANSESNTLNLSLGVGENKGKSSLKYKLELNDQKKEGPFVELEVKSKKKAQLKTYLQSDFRKHLKSTEFNFYQLFKSTFIETEKSLNVVLKSQILGSTFLGDIEREIQEKYNGEQKPVFKVEGDVVIKSSIKNEEGKLSKKRLIKWITQGLSSHFKIRGNQSIIRQFTSSLSEIFPFLKVIRSGDISLKMRHCENVDKLFEKLGINQLCEETPSVHDFLQQLVNQYVGKSDFLGDIIKKILLFQSKIPNQRINLDLNIRISYLSLYLSFSSDSCPEIATILEKTI